MGLSALSAQSYTAAIGARLGSPLSASYKMFINDTDALEGFAGFRAFGAGASWFNLGAAYQIHNDLSSVDGLGWYYGAGGSIFLYSGAASDGAGISVQGYLGLDYAFANEPINLSLDWVPTILLNGGGFDGGFGALAVRYILR